MGSNGASGGGGNSNQVSGNEAFYTKQQKQLQKKTMNTDQKVGTYGDTKTGKTFGGEYSKENQNPNNNIQKQKKKTTAGIVPSGGDGGNTNSSGGPNTITEVTATAPTTAEVSQATATDATADTIETRKKKAKATGRSVTILNRAKGISSDEGLTLGKRSLLGS